MKANAIAGRRAERAWRSVDTFARGIALVAAGAAASCAAIAGIGDPKLIDSGGSGPGGGGAASSSNATSSAATAGGGGSGGSGPPACEPIGKPFTALSPVQLGGHTLSDLPLLIADDASGVHQVHLVMQDTTLNQLTVRSIRDGSPRLTPIKQSPGIFNVQPIGGAVDRTTLRIFVFSGKTLGEVQYKLDAGEIQDGPMLRSWPTPGDCTTYSPGSAAIFWDGSKPHYLLGCHKKPGKASLWIGNDTDGAMNIADDFADSEAKLFPQMFGISGATSFAFFRALPPNDQVDEFSSGNGAQLATTMPFSYAPTGSTLVFAGLLDSTKLTVIGSAVNPSEDAATVFAGTEKLANLSNFWQPLSSITTKAGSFSGKPSFGGAYGLAGADGFVGADKTGDALSVVFSSFDVTGRPIVLEQNVHRLASPATTKVHNARAAALSEATKVAVWTEIAGGNLVVNGQLLDCSAAGR